LQFFYNWPFEWKEKAREEKKEEEKRKVKIASLTRPFVSVEQCSNGR
jgi:hypothetical protein